MLLLLAVGAIAVVWLVCSFIAAFKAFEADGWSAGAETYGALMARATAFAIEPLLDAGEPDRIKRWRTIGVELARKYARLAAERAVKSGLTNVRMWPGDAGALLARRIPNASVREVHVYFPDPWWKKRHKKRRVFNETLVASILRILEPGGELHVATDVEEYHGVIRELLARETRFAEIDPPPLNDPEHDHDYLTNFERKYRIEGRPVYRSSYRLTSTG